MAQSRGSFLNVVSAVKDFLGDLFNLDDDKASEIATIEEIKKGIVFRGTNLWILIFAIMVASVGLNVNSTAVIIGAMLISPLMGPIMGVGLGVGIFDFELIVKALKNLGIAVVISILTSALYFLISPLHDAQSELLARTQPTIWDVLIALFGGLAGIVAGSRREKSNAIPGVAIATALMPPLCTAGFGLATAQWNYFFGAFYLFFINSVFISLSTFLIVRFLHFPKKEFMDEGRERRVKNYIAVFVLITIIPSVLTAINVVRKSLFERSANQFIQEEFQFENTQVLAKKFNFDRNEPHIEITLFGEPVSSYLIDQTRARLDNYGLQGCKLVVRQGYQEDNDVDMETLQEMGQQWKTGLLEELYLKNEQLLLNKDDQIKLLEEEILRLRSQELPLADMAEEVKAINSNIAFFSVSNCILSDIENMQNDTLLLAYADFKRRARRTEISQLEDWLKARTKTEKIKLVVD